MKKQKLATLGALSVTAALLLAACGDEEKKDDKKTDKKEGVKEIKTSSERTLSKDILYTELSLAVYNTLLYSPSANFDTNTAFQSLGFKEGEKPYGYLLLDSTIALMNQLDNKELNESEIELKELVIAIKNQEKKILDIIIDKFDTETGFVVLDEEKSKEYDKERDALIKMYTDNAELIQKTVETYFATEHVDSDEYKAHIEYLLSLYEDEKNEYQLNVVLSNVYNSIQDKDKENFAKYITEFEEVLAKERETEMYKTNNIYKSYIEEHAVLLELKELIEADKFDEAFIRYATIGSLVSLQYGQHSAETDSQYSSIVGQFLTMFKEKTFNDLFKATTTNVEEDSETKDENASTSVIEEGTPDSPTTGEDTVEVQVENNSSSSIEVVEDKEDKE